MELLDKKLTGPGSEISVHPGVTFFLSFFLSLFFVTFFLTENREATWCLYFPFLFSSSVLQSFFSFPTSSLFGTQQQLNHPPVKNSTLSLRKMPVFQGVAPWHKILTSSCVIPLWDSATAHSLSGKEFNPSSQENVRFSEYYTLAYNFHFILHHPSLGLSNSSITLR